jgi:hypothetical protein
MDPSKLLELERLSAAAKYSIHNYTITFGVSDGGDGGSSYSSSGRSNGEELEERGGRRKKK